MKKTKIEDLKRIEINEFKKRKKNPVIIVLDNLRSLNNVGSCFRTSDAFLIQKIYLVGITGTPPNNKIERTALGSTESIEWEYVNSISKIENGIRKIKVCGAENPNFGNYLGYVSDKKLNELYNSTK